LAKDLKIGHKLVNAGAETVHEKPSFRTAFRSKRALIAVDAFYEWLETDQISEKRGSKSTSTWRSGSSGGSPSNGSWSSSECCSRAWRLAMPAATTNHYRWRRRQSRRSLPRSIRLAKGRTVDCNQREELPCPRGLGSSPT
jgi:hypothetical protein